MNIPLFEYRDEGRIETLELVFDYRGEGRKKVLELGNIGQTVMPEDEKWTRVVKTVDFVGDTSFNQLVSTEVPKKFGFNAKPLQVKEALILLLEKVKNNPEILKELTTNVDGAKEETQKGEEYRQLLLTMLKEDDATTRKRIEGMDRLEKDWVMLDNDGIEPEVPPYIYQPPTWGTTAWNATKIGANAAWNATKISGNAAWVVGKFSGKVCYRVYVESARIGTIALLVLLVVENPLFPVLQMIVKQLIL